ncbi:MAG: J domain-containing protein [Chloroflexi bacterium]|nr:J domain-containing protein [Chloroflexota bacterium]
MAKDYYQTLGVAKTATEKEVKQAFRRLAKQYHPDTHPDDPKAEARFKEVNEAYEVLSNKEKRANYDRFGTANPQAGGWSPSGAGGQYTTNVDLGDLSDLFSSVFGNTRTRTRTGATGFARIDGQDIEQQVTISLQEAYTGATRLVTKGDRTVRVNIPAGAKTGTRVRLAGEGEPGSGGGQPGDLYLVVQVETDSRFQREGDDLTVDVRADVFTAMLGGDIEVPTMGRPLKLKIPAGSQSGRKFRLSGKGMPVLNKPDSFGDLYARLLITVPENLTADQRALVEKLRASL